MKVYTSAFLVLIVFPLVCNAQDLTLIRDGKSNYSIVVGAGASASEQRGAKELQTHLKKMSGAELPIVTDAQALPEHAILVGQTRYTDGLHPDVDIKALGAEGFAIEVRGGHILVVGSNVRGAMYGCTALLEKLGVRWFTPKVTFVPSRPTINLPALDDREAPDFEYRELYIAEAFDKDWAARLRTNGAAAALDDSTGGKVVYDHFVHSFDALIPPAEFEKHPEYFPLINGKRTSGYVQRCLSNPEVLKLMTDVVRGWMAKNPKAKIFSVSQNDALKFCQCDNCKAIEARYGGKHSGIYLWFVNQIAEAVEKDYPDKLIDTLAYQFTEEAPSGIVPRKNVRVRLCPISACEAHPYESCTEPKTMAFVKNLRDWSKITDTLYIWHYNTDFGNYLMPFPDFGQFPDSIRLYKRSGVKGIFFEGDATPGSSDAEMRAYVMGHLLWNSKLDSDALVNEWMHGVYGPAYEPMRKWFDLLHEKVKSPDHHLHIFDRPTNSYFLTPEVLAEGDKLFDEAENLVGAEGTGRFYVDKGRMDLRYVELMQKPDEKALDAFVAELPKFGVSQMREGQPRKVWEDALRARIKNGATRPTTR